MPAAVPEGVPSADLLTETRTVELTVRARKRRRSSTVTRTVPCPCDLAGPTRWPLAKLTALQAKGQAASSIESGQELGTQAVIRGWPASSTGLETTVPDRAGRQSSSVPPTPWRPG